jgi:hypothetical protein
LAFLVLFTVGGVTGLFLATMGTDVHLHDTYFVVAHFHFVMVGGMVLAYMAALHYWWPKLFGVMYSDFWSKACAVVIFVGFFLTFVPQFLPDSGPTLPVSLALSAIFAAIYLAWFTGIVTIVGLASDALRRPRVKAWTERITGGALFAFGARLATAARH